MRIMAIGAHPDDIDLGCAGTLARCVRRGDKVTMAIVCRGEAACNHVSPEQLARVRSREARASARVLGAKLIELGLSDGGVAVNDATLALFVDAIRRVKPDVVITHFHSDYGGDHNNTLTLALDATLNATLAFHKTATPPIPRIPLLYMMEPLGGHNFQPQVYVDIGNTFKVKVKMLACHRSQTVWMSRYGGMNLRKYIEVVARFRGYQSRVEFAEGFLPHPSFGHVPAGAVLP